jgi:hypothetical protein
MVPHPQVVLFRRVKPPFAMAMKKVEIGSCIDAPCLGKLPLLPASCPIVTNC